MAEAGDLARPGGSRRGLEGGKFLTSSLPRVHRTDPVDRLLVRARWTANRRLCKEWVVTTPADGAASPDSPLETGTTLEGRYRLIEEIGLGASASVWRAQHIALEHPVAVKFFHVAPNDDTERERLLREARIVAAIHHRNVIDVVDFGTHGPHPYMVMELLDGVSLADRISEGLRLDVPVTIKIISRCLSGLAAVHDAGIVHRDIKPENIFLTTEGDGDYPKIVDFGISRSVWGGAQLKSVYDTMVNRAIGTPEYMSPEQARGLAGVDHRSDLFSIGSVLYELLSDVIPFEGASIVDVLARVVHDDPTPLASHRPDLEGPLTDVVERAMEKDREDRFQSAREMRTALLDAAARTPAALWTRSGRPLHLGTHSDLPPAPHVEPAAPHPVERALEPTDLGGPPRTGDPSPRSWWGVTAAALAAAALIAFALAVGRGAIGTGADPATPRSDPPPTRIAPTATEPLAPDSGAPFQAAATVTVRLRGVPSDALVEVDGAPWPDGTEIELLRADAAHSIVVRQADRRPWRVSHVATVDGAYDVELRAPRSERRPRAVGPTGHSKTRRPPDRFSDPGF